MSSNSRLRSAVRLALGMGAGALAVGYAPGALAQDDSQAGDQLEEITVTGSRIKRADLDSASPVTVLNREDILSTGITDVGNLVQRMPSMSGSPIGTTTNNGGNGSVQIDLRGMGVDRTLTLVNGKRVVDGGDYQTIPATMIERVEVLKDGASAVYGADAVAGVVNIITRKDFEGIEVSAQTADFFDSAGQQTSIGLIAGTTWDGGNFVFGAEYIDQEEAYQSDTPWDFLQNSFYIYPEGCENQLTELYDGTPSGGCYVFGSSRIPQSRLGFINQRSRDDDGNPLPDDFAGNGTFLIGTPNTTPYQVGLMVPHDGRQYNFAPVNYLQTPYERTNVFAEANFDLTDSVRFTTEIRGNFRKSAQELAPMPYNSPTDPAYDGFFTNPVTGELLSYSGISEDNYYLRAAVDAYNDANGTALPYHPISDARRRMIETTRRFTQDITQYQWIAGLEGEFNDMDWEIYYNRGHRSRSDNDFGQFSGPRLSNAFGPSADFLLANGQPGQDGIPECYGDINDPNTLIANCVPFNFFGGGEFGAPDIGGVAVGGDVPTVTTVTQDMIDYVSLDLADFFTTETEIVSASISGELGELGGGAFAWAAGYGYWANRFTYAPDSAKQLDQVTGNVTAGTVGSLYNNSVFLEVLAPFFDNGSQALDVKAGIRYDDWNAFDGDTTWQLGVEFQAIDSLKLRATAGTVFRAPTITDLFSGQFDTFPTYSDPCIPPAGEPLPPGCDQVGLQLDSQLLARQGGNPNLVPETGDTYTAGFVWTPEFGNSGGSLIVDWWRIELEDGISSLGVDFILDDCYVRDNPDSCALITRRSDYSIAQVLDPSLNVAEQGAEGVDTEIRYNWDTNVGTWEASLLWSHLLERTKTAFPGDVEQDLAGGSSDPTAEDGGTYAQDKFNVSLQWAYNNFSIGYLGEYIGELDADTFCNCGTGNQPDGTYLQAVDSQMYHDIVGTYEFEQTGTTITAGVTNITDEEPPFIEVGFNAGTDPSVYRLFGIGYYLRLSQKF